MELRIWNGVVFGAAAALWLASGTQREKPVIEMRADALRTLEASAAADPESAAKVRALAQAYLDAHTPGQAISIVEASSPAVRSKPTVDHVYARALLEQGRAADALAAERRVLRACAPESGGSRCDSWLLASATRRADIMQQLVDLGIEDANAEPEASLVAYHKATREARFATR
jgi:hypothetical protein